MTRTRTLARRSSLMVAMAGAVAFGAVALAPAASAATEVDGSYTVIDKTNGSGPEAFLTDGTGKSPIFFCEVTPQEVAAAQLAAGVARQAADQADALADQAKAGSEAAKDAREAADKAKAPKDTRESLEAAEKVAKKAAEEADKAAKKAAEQAGNAAMDAYKDAKEAAKKAADEAEKAAKDAEKSIDKVMKQHNICQVVSPTGERF